MEDHRKPHVVLSEPEPEHDEIDSSANLPTRKRNHKKNGKGCLKSPRNRLVMFIFIFSLMFVVIGYVNFYYTKESNKLLNKIMESAIKYNAPQSKVLESASRDLLPSV